MAIIPSITIGRCYCILKTFGFVICIGKRNKMGLWSWTSAIWKMWRAHTLCAICLWTLLLLHKIPSWDNKILEYYLSLYAWIMDVDIYFYFYDNTCFIPCKDPCCKIWIICRFYRRNNIISIQVSQIPFISPGRLGPNSSNITLFFVPERKMKKIGLRKIYIWGKIAMLFSATEINLWLCLIFSWHY